jgi:hypothetical protein
MRATHTQLAGYDSVTCAKKRTQHEIILDLFYGGDVTLTRQEISDRTNIRLGSVCGRVPELIEQGALVVRGSRKCLETGLFADTVGLPTEVTA